MKLGKRALAVFVGLIAIVAAKRTPPRRAAMCTGMCPSIAPWPNFLAKKGKPSFTFRSARNLQTSLNCSAWRSGMIMTFGTCIYRWSFPRTWRKKSRSSFPSTMTAMSARRKDKNLWKYSKLDIPAQSLRGDVLPFINRLQAAGWNPAVFVYVSDFPSKDHLSRFCLVL